MNTPLKCHFLKNARLFLSISNVYASSKFLLSFPVSHSSFVPISISSTGLSVLRAS